MATHANVTFRTTLSLPTGPGNVEETRISERYAELSTEQAQYLLIQEQLKFSTRTGDPSEGFRVTTLSSTTKAFSDDTEIETL